MTEIEIRNLALAVHSAGWSSLTQPTDHAIAEGARILTAAITRREAEVRAEALEEAAKVSEDEALFWGEQSGGHRVMLAQGCRAAADRIRALIKEQP